MTMELWMLLASVLLCFVMILFAATPSLMNPIKAAGNREEKLDPQGMWGRADRAAQNMKENLPLFIGTVVVVHLSGSSNDLSVLGAQMFFGARVLYWFIYLAGVPFARTLIWLVSIVGMGLMISSVF